MVEVINGVKNIKKVKYWKRINIKSYYKYRIWVTIKSSC